jgi:hypothetical protein
MLLVQTSWWWTITCSKHIVDNLRAINYKEKCASRWSFSRMYTSVTVNKNRSNIPPSTLMHFATSVGRPQLIVWVDLHFPLWEKQHPKCQRAVRLVHPPFFWHFAVRPTPQTKIQRVRPGDSNTSLGYHSELYIRVCSHNFFPTSTMTDITSQNTALPSWIALHKFDDLIRSKHVALLHTRLIVFITT